jgi:hypothetical protein
LPSRLITFTLLQFSVAHLYIGRLSILEKETSSRPSPVKKLKTNAHGPGHRKKSAAEDLLKLNDSEVELDSLGHLFMQLIDADSSQDDAETSQADVVEVIPVFSDSNPLPRKKTRWVIRKVRFSHPLAHLDPNFLLKKQQHDSRRMTRSDGSQDLNSGLPNTPAPRRHQNEVPHSPTLSLPKTGLFRQPHNPSDSNYQGTPPSSGDSIGTQMPVLKVAQG